MLVDAGGSVGAAAVAQGELAALEVAEELLPFLVGGGAVLRGRAQGAAAGEERAVAVDGFVGVDRLVAHGGVEVAVPDDELGDVRGHAVVDRVGDEDPPEVVRGEPQRLPVGAGQAGGRERFVEQGADAGGADRAVLGADPTLEQDRQRRVEYPLVVVVGGHQRDRAGLVADPADDRAEHVGELRTDDQQPLGVGLGRGDVQQRDQLPGGRYPVLHQAGMGQLGQFLNPHAGQPKDLHGCPGPERPILLAGEVAAGAVCGVCGVFGPDVGRGPGGDRPAQGSVVDGEGLAWLGVLCGGELLRGRDASAVHRGDQRGQHGQPFPGPLIHAGPAAIGLLAVRDLPGLDRAGNRPLCPPRRIVGRPLGDVQVERPHRGQAVGDAVPRAVDLHHVADVAATVAGAGPAAACGLDGDALFPARGDRGVQAQRVDPGVVALQVPPEQSPQRVGQPHQGDVVDADLPFPQVVDQQVADRPAGDAAAVDQLLDIELAVGDQRPHRRRGAGAEHAGCVQQLVKVRALEVGDGAHIGGDVEQFQAVADADVADHTALDRHDRGDSVQRDPSGGFPHRVGPTPRGQLGESNRVSGAGHLRCQPLGGGRGQQPRHARADHVGADQRQQPGAEHHRVEPAIPAGGGLAPADRPAAPVGSAVGFGAAGQPALLPGLAGLGRQPVQHDAHAASAVVLTGGGVRHERWRHQPFHHRLSRQPSLRPAGGHRAGREPLPQPRSTRPARLGRRRCGRRRCGRCRRCRWCGR